MQYLVLNYENMLKSDSSLSEAVISNYLCVCVELYVLIHVR